MAGLLRKGWNEAGEGLLPSQLQEDLGVGALPLRSSLKRLQLVISVSAELMAPVEGVSADIRRSHDLRRRRSDL